LSPIDANQAAAGNQAFATLKQGSGFSGVFANPGELYFDQAAHVLYGNTNADGAADFSIQLAGVDSLSLSALVMWARACGGAGLLSQDCPSPRPGGRFRPAPGQNQNGRRFGRKRPARLYCCPFPTARRRRTDEKSLPHSMKISIQPVILSGGSGTRLWPYSREAYPKQFLSFTGDKTLFQDTVARVEDMPVDPGQAEVRPPVVVCNELHRFLVGEQLRQLGFDEFAIVLEPIGRNTAPALTLAALQACAGDGDPVLVVMPSDHHIENVDGFRRRLMDAILQAAEGAVVTFGIVPTKPETGYGYIRKGAALGGEAFLLDGFVEKPDALTATEYLASGQYLWNSGLFVLRASVWLEQIRLRRPDIAQACQESFAQAKGDGSFVRIDKARFAACPSDSIDYAVMEKLDNGEGGVKSVVLPLDVGWSDLGSWSAFSEVRPQDENGNVAVGDVFLKDATNSLLYAQNRFLAAVGVSDLIVIETTDAVLVVHKDKAQEVKAITDHLKRSARQEHVFHAKVHRPWGDYEGIDNGERYQVKRLTVKPGGSLSRQLHHHRAEHWIVVRGTAKVTRGDTSFLLGENESTFIPLGTPHRLENPGVIPLEIIEVQSGSYLGEDDIVRFEDQYNRIDS
jgi:mannose-1-phosphate guanylyltransferase/mannose-6-phosphate isomerase